MPVIAAKARVIHLLGMSVRPWPSIICRSVLRRSRCAAVIPRCAVDRETRTSFAIVAGQRPGSNAARISRSYPGVFAWRSKPAPREAPPCACLGVLPLLGLRAMTRIPVLPVQLTRDLHRVRRER